MINCKSFKKQIQFYFFQTSETAKTKRTTKTTDYSSWDKYDPDAELLKLEVEEEKKKAERKREREKKQKEENERRAEELSKMSNESSEFFSSFFYQMVDLTKYPK